MIIKGFYVYQIYTAMSNHFRGKSKVLKNEKYGKSTDYNKRTDIWHFEQLGARYPDERELRKFFISQFLNDINTTPLNMLNGAANEIFVSWKRRVANITYNFTNELNEMIKFLNKNGLKFSALFKIKNNNHPLVFKFMTQGLISIETYVIITESLNIDLVMEDDFIFTQWKLKVDKYKAFMNADYEKYRIIIKTETLNNLETLETL